MSHEAHPEDRVERVPLGWRWIDDAFEVAPRAGGIIMRMVDMTKTKAAIRLLRDARVPATVPHLVVRAAALALARNPEVHRLACNYRRVTPGTVDIGLSMAGHTNYAPIVIVPSAETKPLSTLIPFAIRAVDAAVEKEKVDLRNMRRQLWVIPFGFMRRFFLRLMNRSVWFRRRLAGTFQVSMLSQADVCIPLLFYTGSMLATGAVRDRVVAVEGQPVVRPTMWLTLCGDHAAIDGVRAEQLLDAIRTVLEGDELLREAQEACDAKRLAGNGAALPALPAPAEGGAARPASGAGTGAT
jgi:hypothetical protein